MNERQRQLALHEHAVEEDAKLMDIFNCVERLHDANIHKLCSSDRVTTSKIIRVPRPDRGPAKVNANKLFQALPRHIMGCILAKQPSTSSQDTSSHRLTDTEIESSTYFGHVTKAYKLMRNLIPICLNNTNLMVEENRNAMGPSSPMIEQLIDAVNLALLAIAGPEAENLTTLAASSQPADIEAALDRATSVHAALECLILVLSEPHSPVNLASVPWAALTETLFSHPRGGVFLQVVFDAAKVMVAAVRVALCSESSSEDSVGKLAFCTGGAMEFVSYLTATPLFYHRLILSDPHGELPLRLILECLSIHDAPLACPPFKRISVPNVSNGRPVLGAAKPPYTTAKGGGSAELLAARGFALLVLLGEYDSPSYLDQMFKAPDSRALADKVVAKAAAYIGQVLLRPPLKDFPAGPGEPQMSINVLRAAELISDDGNFRGPLIKGLAPTMAQLMQQANEEAFMSLWGSGESAVQYHAGDDILINSVTKEAIKWVTKCGAASRALQSQNSPPGKSTKKPTGDGPTTKALELGHHLALERAVLLSKLLVNLHFYNETLQTGLKDEFINLFITSLKRGPALSVYYASRNVDSLFGLTLQFAAGRCKPEHQLMQDIDLQLATDFMSKLREAAESQKLTAINTQRAPQPAAVPVRPAVAPAPPPPPRPIPVNNGFVARNNGVNGNNFSLAVGNNTNTIRPIIHNNNQGGVVKVSKPPVPAPLQLPPSKATAGNGAVAPAPQQQQQQQQQEVRVNNAATTVNNNTNNDVVDLTGEDSAAGDTTVPVPTHTNAPNQPLPTNTTTTNATAAAVAGPPPMPASLRPFSVFDGIQAPAAFGATAVDNNDSSDIEMHDV